MPKPSLHLSKSRALVEGIQTYGLSIRVDTTVSFLAVWTTCFAGMPPRTSSLLSKQKRMRTMSYAREIRSSLSWDGILDIQGSAKCMSWVLEGNGTVMRISKAEIKVKTPKWRMYSREICDRMSSSGNVELSQCTNM